MSLKSRNAFFNRWIVKYNNLNCIYCNKECRRDVEQCSPDKATVDHIVPTSKGGSRKMDNLTLSCFSCNQKKGNTIWTTNMKTIT